MPKPPHLAPLKVEEQRLYSELLPDGRASHPISKYPHAVVFLSTATREKVFAGLRRGPSRFPRWAASLISGKMSSLSGLVPWP
ncbi:hypothetical protein D4764_12G0008470 [Takifugu flavidus]|uniref:Uncharacterized protein n=1 Tax=Takifugu flavidus TaxID=433684 RepID=A0A5C6PGG2_9TELE|nr:hypothetical protein D4764_12G0008470 [Takifugu flavidus]